MFKNDIISASNVIFLSTTSISTLFFVLLLFFNILISIYFPSILNFTRIISYVVLTLLFVSLLLQEISVIKSLSQIFDLSKRWLPCTSPRKFLQTLSCLMTGYMPTSTTSPIETILIIYGFYVYGFAFPLFICIYLMKDFIDASGVIQNETYKNIIAFGMAFLVYRSLLAARLINFLYLGYLGVALLVANFIAINYVLKKMHRMFVKISAINEREQKSRKINEIKKFTKASLARLKLVPSSRLMALIFEDRIRDNLKTIFEVENRLNVFQSLVTDFEDAANKGDRKAMCSIVDKMIAEIK
ncbi:MAG: hypothetical protein QXO84_00645 [Candidatus Aenigmatarchaeota archaeon]